MSQFTSRFFAIAATLFAASPSFAQSGQAHFHIGNSHSSGQPEAVHELALSEGHTEDRFEKAAIAGSRLAYTITAQEGQEALETLASEPWDVLSMLLYGNGLSFDRAGEEADAARLFYKAALKGNPEARGFLYYDWPGRGAMTDRDLPQDNPSFIQVSQEYIDDIFDPTFQRYLAYYPDSPIYIVPVAQVYMEVAQAMEDGEITGFVNIFDFMPDAGHINEDGQYVAGLTHYVSFYEEDPRGLTADFELNNYFTGERLPWREGVNVDAQDKDGDIEFSESDLAAIQQIVWDVMQNTPRTSLSGHPEDEGSPVAPDDLAATVANHGQIDLTWTDASDYEKTYIVEVTGPDGEFREMTRTLADATSVSVAGLDSATEYALRLRAVNMTGDAVTDPVNARTEPAVGTFQQSQREDGLIVIEAEDYTGNRLGEEIFRDADWIEQSHDSASGNAVMTVPDMSGPNMKERDENAPKLTYDVEIDQSGDYTVWVHAPGSSGESAWIAFDGGDLQQLDHRGWEQIDNAVTLSSGAHALEILLREDGFPLDKIIIAPADAAFTPEGLGPQANSFVPPVDTDSDGLLDSWEKHWFHSTELYAGGDNLDGDPYTLTQEMAMDLSPFQWDRPLRFTLEADDDRQWLIFSIRENRNIQQASIAVGESHNLDAWNTPGIDGINRRIIVTDTDPDGDGSSRLISYQRDVTGLTQFFVALALDLQLHAGNSSTSTSGFVHPATGLR